MAFLKSPSLRTWVFFSGSWVFSNAVVLFFNLNEKKKDINFVNGGCCVIHNDQQICKKTFLIATGQFVFVAPNVHHIFQKGFIFAQTTSDSLEMISMKRICYEV